MCFVVTCWKRADLLALVCGVYYEFVTFPFFILCQVWYLIVSIPDLCTLTYFDRHQCYMAAKFGEFVDMRVITSLLLYNGYLNFRKRPY